MDPLEESDLEISRNTAPAEKLWQALELMYTGIRIKRAALRERDPAASEAQIDAALERWLIGAG